MCLVVQLHEHADGWRAYKHDQSSTECLELEVTRALFSPKVCANVGSQGENYVAGRSVLWTFGQGETAYCVLLVLWFRYFPLGLINYG